MRTIEKVGELSTTGAAILMIGTDWCKYCGVTKKALKAVAAEKSEMDVAMIDGDDDPDVLKQHGGKTYPLVILYKDGERVASRESADEPTLKAWLVEHGVA